MGAWLTIFLLSILLHGGKFEFRFAIVMKMHRNVMQIKEHIWAMKARTYGIQTIFDA